VVSVPRPLRVPQNEATECLRYRGKSNSGFHGNDERSNVEAFRRGVSDYLAIIRAVVYA
jgi:hypothetical protein